MSPVHCRGIRTVTLRELLAGVALVGLACVSLKFASDAWWIAISSVAALIAGAMTIVAFVGHGGRRAFATGFVLTLALYAGAFFLSGKDNELDIYRGNLPTTLAMRPVFEAVVIVRYQLWGSGANQSFATQAEAEQWLAAQGKPVPTGGLGGGGMGGIGVRFSESPLRHLFLSIAHVWWALLLAYLGGRFAAVVARLPDRDASPRAA